MHEDSGAGLKMAVSGVGAAGEWGWRWRGVGTGGDWVGSLVVNDFQRYFQPVVFIMNCII